MRRFLSHKRKFLPLFCGLLIIGVLIGIMIPLTGSAEPSEGKIENYFCRAPQESLSDNKAALRFAFTTNTRKDPQYFGVVYSETSDRPFVGKDGCTVAPAWKVHSSANTTLDGHPAGAGRYWVEIKIGNIWHTHYDDVYYVRPFVMDTDGTYYYGDKVICTSVNETFGHKHTIPSPVSTTSANSLLDPGTKIGTCSVCGRGSRVEYVNPTITSEHFTSSSSGTYVKKANIYSSMLHGARHFYPDESTNDGNGNDLLIEFTLLWNPSLANLVKPYIEIGRIADSNGGGTTATAFYLNFADNVSGRRIPFAGSFEAGTYHTVSYGPAGIYQQNLPKSSCALIGENGWHRIGVRIHEDAWAEGSQVRYKITSTLYVDGHALSQVSKTYDSANVNLLYTATVVEGELQYTDIADGRTVYGIRLENRKAKSGKSVDFIYTDYSVICGRDFVQDVMPVSDAIDKLPSSYPATVFFRTVNHERMPSGVFDLPVSISNTNPRMIQPTEGQHPRLLVTSAELPAVRTAMSASHNNFKRQDIESLVAQSSSFTLTDRGENDDNPGHHMKDGAQVKQILSAIQAKAFYYLLYGDVTRGSEAIAMMDSLLNQIDDLDDSHDKCRTFGEGMYVAALVYDWCYDLMDSTQKETLIRKVTDKLCKQFVDNPDPSWNADLHRMEVSFPPYKQSPVNDHGCERQILRDYLSFALAIFDEDRTWYDYVGGRFFQQFVPVRNEIYESGYSTQGFSNYLEIRFGSDLWSAWLMKYATGVFPYESEDNMMNVMRSAYSHVTNGVSRIFQEGDEQGSGESILKKLERYGMMSAYLFHDSTGLRWAHYAGMGSNEDFGTVEAVHYMILRSAGLDSTSTNRYNDLSLILYNGGYLKQTIAHKSWGNDASVFMKIGGVRIGGHDHDDAGSFQIYYKEPLAVDSGVYDTWNSDQHRYYHRRTIAHNSVVFYNTNGTNLTQQTTDYDGLGLGTKSEFLAGCASPNVDLTTFGHEEGYVNQSGLVPAYAYIAGDIAGTYETGEGCTVNRMDRRMLAVYDTEDDDVPMYFFVFDATETSTAAKPAFLLHVPKGGSSSVSGKTITITNGNGQLILQNVYCGNGTGTPEIKAFLGNDKYKVGTQNYTTSSSGNDASRGRYEIRPTSALTSGYMLNVMLVAESDSGVTDTNHKAAYFTNSGNTVIGTQIGNTAAVFVKSKTRQNQSFNFAAPGNANTDRYNYYVSGVAKGTWRVTDASGGNGFTVHTTEDSGLLVFNAYAGMVQLTYLGNN